MSTWYALLEALILNWTVWPAAALMSVVKPWISALPEPDTSHSFGGVPGRQFSATISFAGAAPRSVSRAPASSAAMSAFRPAPGRGVLGVSTRPP